MNFEVYKPVRQVGAEVRWRMTVRPWACREGRIRANCDWWLCRNLLDSVAVVQQRTVEHRPGHDRKTLGRELVVGQGITKPDIYKTSQEKTRQYYPRFFALACITAALPATPPAIAIALRSSSVTDLYGRYYTIFRRAATPRFGCFMSRLVTTPLPATPLPTWLLP